MPKSAKNIALRTEQMKAMYERLYKAGYMRTRIIKKIADQFFVDKTTVYRYLPVKEVRKKCNLKTNDNSSDCRNHSHIRAKVFAGCNK